MDESTIVYGNSQVVFEITHSSLRSSTPIGSFPLGDFKIEYLLNDAIIEIEAENHTTRKFYNKKLNHNNISQITSGLYDNTSEFADLIRSCLSKTSPDMSLTINEEAKINIKVKLIIGGKGKLLSFEIQLEEEKLGNLDLTRKYLKKLGDVRKGEAEEQILTILDKLIDCNSNLEKQLDEEKAKNQALEKFRSDQNKEFQDKILEALKRIEELEKKFPR